MLTGLNGLRRDAAEVPTATGAALLHGEALVVNDDVLGAGSCTGNMECQQGFMPRSSLHNVQIIGISLPASGGLRMLRPRKRSMR